VDWLEGIGELQQHGQDFVMVTILTVEGSAPRDAGTKMLVSAENTYDTIGGGNLEFDAVAAARKMLVNPDSTILKKSYTLGADLTQCCGGRVEVLFETIRPAEFSVVLFGAGHVGQALASILEQLPCRLTWIDSREDIVAACGGYRRPPVVATHPELLVESQPANSYFLVMTHSHEQDYALVEAILSRPDAAFCGLIGSRSKAAKFRNRLFRKKFSEQEVARLTCPVGDTGITGKQPMEVAVSIASQLIRLRQQACTDSTIQPAAVGEVIALPD
jgi:xanthine dehydrogenase accessory factor